MIKRFPATTRAGKVEEVLHDMWDEATTFVAVEVFGPTEAMRYDKAEDAECGPWMVGPADEVYEAADATGYPYETQYELSPPEDDIRY